jgi:hypothetical protein
MSGFIPFRSDDEVVKIGRGLEDCNELLEAPLEKPEWILTYWSPERLFSVEARRDWLEPDIRPFPF